MNSLLIRVGDYWWVWKKLGKETGWLRAKVVSMEDNRLPPLHGWQFYDENKWFNNWTSDPTIECHRKLPSKVSAARSSQMKSCFVWLIFLLVLCSQDVQSCFCLLVSCLDLGLRLVVGLVIVVPLIVTVAVFICCRRR